MKQRPMAAELVETGHVRLNRAQVTKPGHVLRPDDVLTIAVGGHVRVLRVKDLGTRRGPFSQACQLYEDLTSAPSRDEKDRA
ncbi:MAG TPA: S4 domain-containing protein [Aestuariivirga sp.]|nr:S4 domain-containing protein [Aestuariivirga sp.]